MTLRHARNEYPPLLPLSPPHTPQLLEAHQDLGRGVLDLPSPPDRLRGKRETEHEKLLSFCHGCIDRYVEQSIASSFIN